MVFLHASAEAHDHYFFTERWSLADSPAIAAAVGDALAAAGLDTDDVARFDLYSCFPSAVQVAMRALGIADDDPRPLTVTGGLGFAGGPVNNYPTHAIARMVEVLPHRPGQLRLHDRARLVHHEARRRGVVGVAPRARFPARRPGHDPGPRRRATAAPTRRPDRRSTSRSRRRRSTSSATEAPCWASCRR